MHISYLGIGSNTTDALSMIERAYNELEAKGCRIEASSGIYMVNAPYCNLVVRAESSCTYDGLKNLTKQIEISMGRTPQMKLLGIVPIDIDVVIFDGEVMRRRDYDAEYFAKGYRQIAESNGIKVPNTAKKD